MERCTSSTRYAKHAAAGRGEDRTWTGLDSWEHRNVTKCWVRLFRALWLRHIWRDHLHLLYLCAAVTKCSCSDASKCALWFWRCINLTLNGVICANKPSSVPKQNKQGKKTHFQAAGWKQNNQIMHHVRGERQQTPGEHIPARRAANVADGAVKCVIHVCHRPDWGKQWRNKHCKRKHDTKLSWSMISVQLHLYYTKTPENSLFQREGGLRSQAEAQDQTKKDYFQLYIIQSCSRMEIDRDGHILIS